MEKPREETRILEELTKLVGSPGYAHALATICHRDNTIYFQGKLAPSS